MDRNYQYLKVLIGSTSCLISDISIEELGQKFQLNFDPKVEETEVNSFPRRTNGIVNFKILEVIKGGNIQDLLEDSSGDDLKNIAFDTLSTVLCLADTNRSLLSMDGNTDLFVFGDNKDFFIARVHKIRSMITVYVGLKNFDLPFKGEGVHRLFIKV